MGILEADDEIRDIDHAYAPKQLKGQVEFNNVTHRYSEDDNEALTNIDFKAEPGKIIGLIGATGSGKTSITQLITRFYEPDSGEVLIDGKNVNEYSLNALRSNIGFVFQESFLFSSTIKANIAYGKPEASMEEIIDAAKRADAHEFISRSSGRIRYDAWGAWNGFIRRAETADCHCSVQFV